MWAPFWVPIGRSNSIRQGGVVVYPDILGNPDVLDKVNQATVNFGANNNDPKAAIITSYNYFLDRVSPFSTYSSSNSINFMCDAADPDRDHFLRCPGSTFWSL